MDECHKLTDLYGAYIYGDTTDDEAQMIRSHLAVCEKCRMDLDERESVLRAIPNTLPKLGHEDRQRIAWSVKAEVRRKREKRTFWRVVAPAIHNLSLAASVVVIFAGGTLFGLHLKQNMASTDIPPPKTDQKTSTAPKRETPKPEVQPDIFVGSQPPSIPAAGSYSRSSSHTRTSRSHVPRRFEVLDNNSWRLMEWYPMEPVDLQIPDGEDKEPAVDEPEKSEMQKKADEANAILYGNAAPQLSTPDGAELLSLTQQPLKAQKDKDVSASRVVSNE